MTGAKYFLVKNFINNTQFFQWDQATYNSYFHRIKDATDLTIPKLNEMAYEQVEVASVPFLKFVANKGLQRRGRQLLLRAARLCPALARQCLERVRPHQADRHRRRRQASNRARGKIVMRRADRGYGLDRAADFA